MDLAKNYPPRTLTLVGPTVELVARDDLHPALSDLLIARRARDSRRARDVPRRGRIPGAAGARLPHQRRRRALLQVGRAVPVQAPAVLARQPARSRAGRVAAAAGGDRAGDARGAGALPLARPLAHLSLVRRADGDRARDADDRGRPSSRTRSSKRLDDIEGAVNELKTPLSFADQLYVLRDHVATVRGRLQPMSCSAELLTVTDRAEHPRPRPATYVAPRRRRGLRLQTGSVVGFPRSRSPLVELHVVDPEVEHRSTGSAANSMV